MGSPLAWIDHSMIPRSGGKEGDRGGLTVGEVCLGEMEMGMQSAVLLGCKISGVRRAAAAWPQVPTAWVET